MLRRDDALGQVVGPREIGQALGHGEPAEPEVRFEHTLLDRQTPAPPVGYAAGSALQLRQVVGGQGAPRADLFQDRFHVVSIPLHELLEAPWAHPVRLSAVAEQRPGLDRDD